MSIGRQIRDEDRTLASMTLKKAALMGFCGCLAFAGAADERPIRINGALGRVWRGDVKADAVTLGPNEAAVFEVK